MVTVLGDSCEVIYVDDERIKKHFIRELEGVVDIHYHYEPRMVGVYSLPIQAKMWDGEYVEVELDEEVAMLGVITELAAHHPRARLYVNGVNQTPQYLDTFLMGQADGIGCIKWFILPTGKKKTVRLQVTGSYNPIMPEKQRARGSGFCFGGFIIKRTLEMPTPVYTSISWSHKDLNSNVIPKDGTLDIADIPHPCELQFLKVCCDSSEVEIDFFDGWGRGLIGNLTWSFSLKEFYDELGKTKERKIDSYGSILRWDGQEKCITVTLPLSFMAAMRITLKNLSGNQDIKLTSMRCIAKVRVC
ncbi:MAG TPA: hypothetical protein ENF56_01840 [Candidatus Bathyarchaeota archaeon]|nr:hypothetical protein [Candidatus Bathyarchaeota archaeon]